MSDAYTDIAKQTKKALKQMQEKTMTPAPHPLRCETCKREGCYFHPSKAIWRNGMIPQKAISINNPISIPEFINRFGCASHSASSDVLDKVISLIVLNTPEMEGKRMRITILELCQRIEELRQQGER